jgi:tRNA U34 2-thiouridine synthase MnmA/TrmU
VLEVDVDARTVVVGDEARLAREEIAARQVTWSHEPLAVGSEVMVQTSAHGQTRAAVLEEVGDATFVARYREAQRRTAPGQSVVLYDADDRCVVAGGIAR